MFKTKFHDEAVSCSTGTKPAHRPAQHASAGLTRSTPARRAAYVAALERELRTKLDHGSVSMSRIGKDFMRSSRSSTASRNERRGAVFPVSVRLRMRNHPVPRR